jgi:hypothetical protein
MLIASRGRGWLIAGISFACLLATEVCTRLCFHDDSYYQRHGWPKLAAFLIAAGLVWSLLPHGEGEGFVFRQNDTLFLVPARFWPVILCTLGLVFYVVRI